MSFSIRAFRAAKCRRCINDCIGKITARIVNTIQLTMGNAPLKQHTRSDPRSIRSRRIYMHSGITKKEFVRRLSIGIEANHGQESPRK